MNSILKPPTHKVDILKFSYENYKHLKCEKYLKDTFLNAVFHMGHLDFIKEFASSSYENLNFSITTGFKTAAYDGQLSLIKYLLTSPELKRNSDIHYDDDYALVMSSYKGKLNTVKYLLTSPDLKEHADISARDNCSFIFAAQANQLDVVKFLMESSELKEHSKINECSPIKKMNAFMSACAFNAVDAVKYLANCKKLNVEQALYQLNEDSMNALMLACDNQSDRKIIEIIILEMEFIIEEATKNYFKENLFNPLVSLANELISIRDLNLKLNHKLNIDYKEKIKKIKI